MDEDVNKVRKFNLDTEEGESMLVESESPDKEPVTKIPNLADVDDDMLDSMNEVDRKILAAAILGVDITEITHQRESQKSLGDLASEQDHRSTSQTDGIPTLKKTGTRHGPKSRKNHHTY